MFQAFFNTSYILDEPINSLKTDNCTTDINLKLNHNEVNNLFIINFR